MTTYNICGGRKCCPTLNIAESCKSDGNCSGNTCKGCITITDDYNGKVQLTKRQAKELAEKILSEVE